MGARQACDLGQEASEHPLFRLPLQDVVEPTHGLVDEGVGLRAGLDLQVDRLAAVQELSNLFQRLQAMGVERHDHPPMIRDPAPVQAHLSLEDLGVHRGSVSFYSPWTTPHASTESCDIVSDASAHRIVSDLSAFIGRRRGHRIVAAGDLNVLYGHGEYGNAYWAGRYETVFTRMKGSPETGVGGE